MCSLIWPQGNGLGSRGRGGSRILSRRRPCSIVVPPVIWWPLRKKEKTIGFWSLSVRGFPRFAPLMVPPGGPREGPWPSGPSLGSASVRRSSKVDKTRYLQNVFLQITFKWTRYWKYICIIVFLLLSRVEWYISWPQKVSFKIWPQLKVNVKVKVTVMLHINEALWRGEYHGACYFPLSLFYQKLSAKKSLKLNHAWRNGFMTSHDVIKDMIDTKLTTHMR